MGKSYSSDLRERVLGYVQAGHSQRAAGLRFAVSASSAVRVVQRHDATGSVEPARQGRPPGGGKLAQHLDYLMACVQEQPDITLPELAARLQAERGVQVDPSSLALRRRAAGAIPPLARRVSKTLLVERPGTRPISTIVSPAFQRAHNSSRWPAVSRPVRPSQSHPVFSRSATTPRVLRSPIESKLSPLIVIAHGPKLPWRVCSIFITQSGTTRGRP